MKERNLLVSSIIFYAQAKLQENINFDEEVEETKGR